MYWFFYGTAFVIGILEIVAGELRTGTVRFIAVTLKTFVLCLGAGFGLYFALQNHVTDNLDYPLTAVWAQSQYECTHKKFKISESDWRWPLYLICCLSCLGQWHALTCCYGQHRGPVARSNRLLWPTPQASGTL